MIIFITFFVSTFTVKDQVMTITCLLSHCHNPVKIEKGRHPF